MFQHTIWKRRSTKNRTENTITITTSSTRKTKGKSSTIKSKKSLISRANDLAKQGHPHHQVMTECSAGSPEWVEVDGLIVSKNHLDPQMEMAIRSSQTSLNHSALANQPWNSTIGGGINNNNITSAVAYGRLGSSSAAASCYQVWQLKLNFILLAFHNQ